MAWITTKNGKRINTDWFDDDAKKKGMQIEASKKEAESRNDKEAKWNKQVDDYINKMVDNTQIKPGKPTKMSNKVFESNFTRVLAEVKNNKANYKSLANLYGNDKEKEYINSKQTLRGIQYLIDSEARNAKINFRSRLIGNDEFNQTIKTLHIIQNTLNNIKKDKNY